MRSGSILSGGVTGQLAVVKSGKLYDYTDTFPTVVELGLSTQDNSDGSTTNSRWMTAPSM